eukprot:5279071-Pleurochrysis_carterae.AAC.3
MLSRNARCASTTRPSSCAAPAVVTCSVYHGTPRSSSTLRLQRTFNAATHIQQHKLTICDKLRSPYCTYV